MSAEVIRPIILADDHSVIRAGLKLVVERSKKYKVVREAANGKELLAFLEEVPCDIVVLDLGMPEMNGLAALEVMQKKFPKVKTVVLTTHKERSFLRKSLQLGALGYILKEDAYESLIAAMDSTLKNQKYISRDLMNLIVDNFTNDSRDGMSVELLTDREKQVLHLTANGLTSKEIAERLEISHRTVEVHRGNIREKLGFANNSELMKYAIENGYD